MPIIILFDRIISVHSQLQRPIAGRSSVEKWHVKAGAIHLCEFFSCELYAVFCASTEFQELDRKDRLLVCRGVRISM